MAFSGFVCLSECPKGASDTAVKEMEGAGDGLHSQIEWTKRRASLLEGHLRIDKQSIL